jgi:hypothetical protein|tara:strand:- start:117 stop:224 length:108 start_codon:yes stop_codon:yes gene_type:complete
MCHTNTPVNVAVIGLRYFPNKQNNIVHAYTGNIKE